MGAMCVAPIHRILPTLKTNHQMSMKNAILAAMLVISQTVSSQTLTCDFSKVPEAQELQVSIYPAADHSPSATMLLKPDGKGRFSAVMPEGFKSGIYNLYAQTNSFQTSLPVYLDATVLAKPIKVKMKDYVMSTSLSDNANRDLQAAADVFMNQSRHIGTDFASMSDDQLLTALKSYVAAADSILAVRPTTREVSEYIRLWAYISASDIYTLARYMGRRTDRIIPFPTSEFLPPAWDVLDTPQAVCFPTVSGIVASSLPSGEIEDRIASLHEHYKDPHIRAKTLDLLLDDFLRGHDYQNKFDEGESRLVAITDRYNLSPSWLRRYRAKRASVAGVPFPEGVILKDREGNEVDFGTFAGKYVYVDLWASWCGPCIKEIPHLQALEKELEGGNVVFVSISTDSSPEPWLKKAAALDVHGNQLWDSTNSLASKLNVRGIPHFLIYGPDGTLYRYNAPRPSNPETKALLQSLN